MALTISQRWKAGLADGLQVWDRRQKSSKSPRFLSNHTDTSFTQPEETRLWGVGEAKPRFLFGCHWLEISKYETSKCRCQVGLKVKRKVRTDVKLLEFSIYGSWNL